MKRSVRKRSSRAAARSRTVVIIGSYREDLPGLLAFSERVIDLGFQVLHPPPHARRVGESSEFVRLDCDRSTDEGQVQRAVFACINRADAVILYNPSGRVGVSAAMEIGYSLRARKPIFAVAAPADVTIRALIDYVPGALQEFLRRISENAGGEHARFAYG
jgi:nucleoside 2-deoxyribosyltransferase